MRWLFVKQRLAWPRSSGHDVHAYHMMRELASLGHEVSLVTRDEVDPHAGAGIDFTSLHRFDTSAGEVDGLTLSWSQERYRSYWGIEPNSIRHVGRLARDLGADAVVVVGLNVLPYLADVRGSQRIWYAGDEGVYHHWSQVRFLRPGTWGRMKKLAIEGFYERAYAPLLDRVWVVSEGDRRAFRWVTGLTAVDVIPNGVDAEHFAPGVEPKKPDSCVFWGRLDFGPNVQALTWFCRRVWPRIRKVNPDARFSIYGFQPTEPVRQLAREEAGIELIPDREDIRAEVRRHAVAVMPFVSGGGIKNKLLEAAAMGMPIVATSKTVRGLDAGDAVRVAERPRLFADAIVRLWGDGAARASLGASARKWVLEQHTWRSAAVRAAASVQPGIGEVMTA